jgi:hypothetical protein
MAGAGAKKFPAFSKLSSDDVNNYLADQVIMRFATTAARDAAFGGVGEPTLAEGMTAYIDDTNQIQSYNGSNWITISPIYNAIGRRTSTLVISNSGNSDIVDTTNFSGTITANVGDLLQATFSTTLSAGSNIIGFNFYTFNGASPINAFYAPSTFNPFLFGSSYDNCINLVALYKVVAGDIFSGQVTAKLTANAAGTSRSVVNSSIPASFTLTNLGRAN